MQGMNSTAVILRAITQTLEKYISVHEWLSFRVMFTEIDILQLADVFIYFNNWKLLKCVLACDLYGHTL